MICRHGTEVDTELAPPCMLCRVEALEDRISTLNKDIKAAWDTNRAIDNARKKELETVQRYRFIMRCLLSQNKEKISVLQRIEECCAQAAVPVTDEQFDSFIDNIRR